MNSKKPINLNKNERNRASKILKKHEDLVNKFEKDRKKLEKHFKESKENIRKMKKTNMWLGLILGLSAIILVSTIVIREFMSTTPNLAVITIDIFAFFLSINLIYQSYKTRNELRKQIQEEILEELEKE